ncbi:hypothetical protein Y045_5958 [Burkholderia pseudomallei MSHR2451]|nr:hypothetical protein X990_5629 [Burkholderia pseudomallei MSHR4868]KGW37013.1 hypothetical protein Y045_5958 [Burkholderia pseudomallei MSHR2451]
MAFRSKTIKGSWADCSLMIPTGSRRDTLYRFESMVPKWHRSSYMAILTGPNLL